MSYFTPFLNKYILKMTLTLDISDGGETEDEWGNPTPKTVPKQVICYVKDMGAKADRRDFRPGGAGINSTYLEGFLVHPMLYPGDVVPPFECPANIADLDGVIRYGKFHALPRIPQPYERDYTGERIKGWFVLNS